MFSFLKSRNERLLKKYHKLLIQVNEKKVQFATLTDGDLQLAFSNLRPQLKDLNIEGKINTLHKNYQHLLTTCFAIVREASKRVMRMRHFDVQIIGGLILNDGKIAEMKTGEGKTLVATLPAVFNAGCGLPVHVITANDYLCHRDFQIMSPLYKFLGLEVGCISSATPIFLRSNEYSKNIIYATNNEIGFDYLRDNMRDNLTVFLKRGFCYCIVDEIDSILIDEARTPLIISGPLDIPIEIYKTSDKVAKQITAEMVDIDEKTKQIHLKDEGYDKIETLLRQYGLTKEGEFVYGSHYSNVGGGVVKTNHDPDFFSRAAKIMNCVEQALKANKIFKENVDYILKGNKVQIVDEFTGRIMEGRRYSEGLHQAIEAKHGVPILQESQTLASTSYQNLFRLYKKLSGMTGTAKTEEDEFIGIYNLEVISVPTNKPLTRKDEDDLVYASEEEKLDAIANKVKELYEKGQPVLVGTVSIDKSEKLSKLFEKSGIIHKVLNAKHHAQEAEIISQAGSYRAVTIATNMAGRGTDIILGGNVDHKIAILTKEGKTAEAEKLLSQQQENNKKVKECGGLFILGSERHESRRIDNQLRGRAGRQGDVGVSQFYLSLEDDLLRIFGGDRIKAILTKVGLKKGEVINHSFLNTVIKKAQQKVENYNFDIRKNLIKYDDVINEQRIIFYNLRKKVVQNIAVCCKLLEKYFTENIELINLRLKNGDFENSSPFEAFSVFLPTDIILGSVKEGVDKLLQDEIVSLVSKKATEVLEAFFKQSQLDIAIVKIPDNENHDTYNEIEDSMSFKAIEQAQKIRSIFLHIFDENWKDHLHAIDNIRSSISLRSYAQKDPLNEYKIEAYNSFEQMLFRCKNLSILSCFANICLPSAS